MITANRPELATRALECFRAQAYPDKRLLIVDTGKQRFRFDPQPGELRFYWLCGKTIGEIRNFANENAAMVWPHDIICAWDDDDHSHPDRISEQVDLLQASGADLVAYNEMLFWRQDAQVWQAAAAEAVARNSALDFTSGNSPGVGEAWVYTGGPIGTSFCYWRKTWEKHPFEPTSYGEDNKFWRAIQSAGGKVTSVSSLDAKADPMMIARIHGSNTSNYDPQSMRDAPHHWTRSPQHDEYCRKVLTTGADR